MEPYGYSAMGPPVTWTPNHVRNEIIEKDISLTPQWLKWDSNPHHYSSRVTSGHKGVLRSLDSTTEGNYERQIKYKVVIKSNI